MTETLIARDDQTLQVIVTQAATELKQAALETASLIRKVENALQQENAVAAQTEIRRVVKLVEESRKAIKAPILDYGRKIDQTAEAFVKQLKAEELRVARLVGDFQTLELAKARAAEAARKAELDAIERRKQEELAQATTHEQLEAVQHRYNEEAAAIPAIAPVRAAGQVVKEEWDIKVFDIATLYKAYPGCVKLTEDIPNIKALLKIGITPPGVSATKVVNSTVRLKPESAIEV